MPSAKGCNGHEAAHFCLLLENGAIDQNVVEQEELTRLDDFAADLVQHACHVWSGMSFSQPNTQPTARQDAVGC